MNWPQQGIPDVYGRNWIFSRLKHYVQINPSKSEISHLSKGSLVTFLPMEAVSESGEFETSKAGMISDFVSGYTYFRDGDVLLAKITPCFENGKTALVYGLENEVGFGSTEFHVLRAKPKMDGRYLAYIVRSHAFRSYGEASMTGAAGQKRVPESFVSGFAQHYPPLDEQKVIASFLDRETTKLDQLVDKKQRLIELLQEKRQALITQAVTKGLDSNVPMKDSGIPWLGEVPAHWDIVKIKQVSKTVSGGTPIRSNIKDFFDGDIKWIRTLDLTDNSVWDSSEKITQVALQNSNCKVLPRSTLMVAMYGGGGTIGKSGLLEFEATTNQAICAILPSSKLVPYFGLRVLNFLRPFWMVYAEGTRRDPNISQSVVGNMYVPVPPIQEQKEISTALESQLSTIQHVQNKLENQIGVLNEYHQALISAAVTGQIDVRQAAGATEEVITS